jgi:hypothetical protein
MHLRFSLLFQNLLPPITVAAPPKALIVFARSNAGIVGSKPTQGMDVCVCVYSLFVLSCVYVAALRRADHWSMESSRLCKNDYETKTRGLGPTRGCRVIDE